MRRCSFARFLKGCNCHRYSTSPSAPSSIPIRLRGKKVIGRIVGLHVMALVGRVISRRGNTHRLYGTLIDPDVASYALGYVDSIAMLLHPTVDGNSSPSTTVTQRHIWTILKDRWPLPAKEAGYFNRSGLSLYLVGQAPIQRTGTRRCPSCACRCVCVWPTWRNWMRPTMPTTTTGFVADHPGIVPVWQGGDVARTGVEPAPVTHDDVRCVPATWYWKWGASQQLGAGDRLLDVVGTTANRAGRVSCPISLPPILRRSTFPNSKVRVSSGAAKLFCSGLAMLGSLRVGRLGAGAGVHGAIRSLPFAVHRRGKVVATRSDESRIK